MKILNQNSKLKSNLSGSSQIVLEYLLKAAWHPHTIDIDEHSIAASTNLDLLQVKDAMVELEMTGLISTR